MNELLDRHTDPSIHLISRERYRQHGPPDSQFIPIKRMGRPTIVATLSFPAFREGVIAIRVQLGSMPRMLGDIVVQLLGTLPDVAFVGRADEGEDPLDAARMTHADLLIVREPDGALGSILAQPGLSVLQISPDGQDGSLVRFAPHHVPLDRDSIATIAALVHGRVAGHA